MAQKVNRGQLTSGLISNRQGGTSGDGSWLSPGTSNTDTSSKQTIVQAGSILSTAADFSVTFPNSFSQIPIVICQVASASSYNGTVRAVTVNQNGFTGRFMDTSWTIRAGETINWIAVGQ